MCIVAIAALGVVSSFSIFVTFVVWIVKVVGVFAFGNIWIECIGLFVWVCRLECDLASVLVVVVVMAR